MPGLLAKDAGDVQSGLLTVRIWERKHELLGMNSAAKIEIVQAPAEEPSSYERIRQAIMRVARPGWEPSDDLSSDLSSDGDGNGNGNGNGQLSGHKPGTEAIERSK